MKTPEEARKALATIRAKLAPEFAKLGLVPREHRDDSWELDGTSWNTIVSIESRSTGSWSTTYRDTVLRFAGRYREPRFTARSVVLWSRERGAIDDKGIAELIALVAERVRLEKLAIEQETRNEQRQAAAKKMVAALRRELGRLASYKLRPPTPKEQGDPEAVLLFSLRRHFAMRHEYRWYTDRDRNRQMIRSIIRSLARLRYPDGVATTRVENARRKRAQHALVHKGEGCACGRRRAL